MLVALTAPGTVRRRAGGQPGHRSRVRDRGRRRARVRLVRRAHGPLRLWRHLRAGPSDRRRRRSARRRPRSRARARRDDRALPGRQLRVRLRLGGRDRPARAAPAAARAGLALDRDQPVRHRRLPRLDAQGRARPDARRQHGHARARRRAPPRRVLQRARGHRVGRPPACERPRRPVRRARVVHRERDGRPVADRPHGRGRLWQGRERDRQGDAPRRPLDRARRLRQLALADADVRRLGGHGARPRVGGRRPHLAPHLLRPGEVREHGGVPRLRRSTSTG